MNEINPFAPPVHDELGPNRTPIAQGRFFAVARTKFAIMCLGTFGLYELYWFYQQWKHTKARTGSDISPLARAIFALFFTHALLRDVQVAAAEVGVKPRFGVHAASWAFIGLTLASSLPDPFWFISLMAFVPLIAVQDAINEIQRRASPNAGANARLGLGNWGVLAVGFVFWALNILALVLPEELLAQ